MTMAAYRRLVLSTDRLFETRWLVNCTVIASHRGLVAGALYRGSSNFTEPNTYLSSLLGGYMAGRRGIKGVLGCTRVDAKWVEESLFPTFSSSLGCRAIFDVASRCVKRASDGPELPIYFFADSCRSSVGMSYGLGGVLSYASTSSRLVDAGFVRSFCRACCTEVDTRSRRSRNLEIYGQNNVTNDRVLSEIFRILQKDKKLEVIKLGENCHVRLVVRTPESDLFLGISVKAAKTKDAYGRFCFAQCRKYHNVLNLCASLPSPENKYFRWWIIPGEQLVYLKSDRLKLHPEGKWARFEIDQGKITSVILKELTRRIACQVPLSEWSIPKSPTHQKELEYFSQMTRKVWAPLACVVTNPSVHQSSIDVIIDGVCVQNKTAFASEGSRGLRIDIRKQAGRVGFGKYTTQPYTIYDGIDAIAVNVQQHGTLTGVFLFPKKEIIARGWFRGGTHSGKVAAYVFPPHLSPRKGYESTQQWQLQYYLDVSDDVDLDRAKILLDHCKNGKRENK